MVWQLREAPATLPEQHSSSFQRMESCLWATRPGMTHTPASRKRDQVRRAHKDPVLEIQACTNSCRVRRKRSREAAPEAIPQEHKAGALSCPSPTAVGQCTSAAGAALTSFGEQAVALHHQAPSHSAPPASAQWGMQSYPNCFLAAAEGTPD